MKNKHFPSVLASLEKLTKNEERTLAFLIMIN